MCYLIIKEENKKQQPLVDSILVIKFRVRIPQRLLVVLGKVSKIKVLLYYVKKNPAVLPAVVGDPSNTPKRETDRGSSPGKKVESKFDNYLLNMNQLLQKVGMLREQIINYYLN